MQISDDKLTEPFEIPLNKIQKSVGHGIAIDE